MRVDYKQTAGQDSEEEARQAGEYRGDHVRASARGAQARLHFRHPLWHEQHVREYLLRRANGVHSDVLRSVYGGATSRRRSPPGSANQQGQVDFAQGGQSAQRNSERFVLSQANHRMRPGLSTIQRSGERGQGDFRLPRQLARGAKGQNELKHLTTG